MRLLLWAIKKMKGSSCEISLTAPGRTHALQFLNSAKLISHTQQGSALIRSCKLRCKASDKEEESPASSDSESSSSLDSGSSSSPARSQVPHALPSVPSAPAVRSTLASTIMWRGFRINAVWDPKDKSIQIGWEVSCVLTHADKGDCRKRMMFSVHGGEENTLHIAKRWCTMSYQFSTRIEHRDCFVDCISFTDEELESVPMDVLPKGCTRRRFKEIT